MAGKVAIAPNTLGILPPIKPQQTVQNPYMSGLGTKIKAPDSGLLGQFMSAYNGLTSNMPSLPSYQGIGNAGTGQYNYGNAGLGQWGGNQAYNVGTDTGQGMYGGGQTWNAGGAGQGQFDVGPAGLGTYGSDIIKLLQGKVRQGLTDSGGWVRDKLQGAETAAQQGLDQRFAGWGRGNGIANAAQDALNRSMLQNRAGAARDYEAQTQGAGMNLENMLGGQYYQGKSNELANKSLAEKAFSDAKSRELQNAGLNFQGWNSGQSAFDNAKARELQLAGLGLQASNDYQNRGLSSWSDSMKNQLANAGLAGSAYENAQNRAMQGAEFNANAANQGNQATFNNQTQAFNNQLQALSPLEQMLQWYGNAGMQAQQGTFNNQMQQAGMWQAPVNMDAYNKEKQLYDYKMQAGKSPYAPSWPSPWNPNSTGVGGPV